MKTKHVLFAVLCCFFAFNTAFAQKENRSWDFTNWSQETLEMLANSPDWVLNNEDPAKADRYNRKETIAKDVTVYMTSDGTDAGTSFQEFAGLKVSTSGGTVSGGNFGLVFAGNQRIRTGSANLKFTVADCKAGDIVIVACQSANSTDLRGITATNATRLYGADAVGAAGKIVNIFKVSVDGDVILAANKGIELYSITINPKIAYITKTGEAGETASDASDKKDVVAYPILTSFGAVTLFNSSEYTEDVSLDQLNTLFGDFDLVVASESVAGANKLGVSLKNLVGVKPFLNFKSFFYTVNGRWGWAAPDNGPVDGSAHTVAINEGYAAHPIFSEVTLTDNTLRVFNDLAVTPGRTDKKGVQGFKLPIVETAEGSYIANVTPDVISFHEINNEATAKYLMLPFCSDNFDNINENGAKVIEQAVMYLLSNVVFRLPSNKCAITEFAIGDVSAVITEPTAETNGKVEITLPAGTDVTALAPTITISEYATVAPASGVVQDFTNAVAYTVTAEDGTTAVYDVTVTLKTYYTLTFDAAEGVTLDPADASVKVEENGNYTFSVTTPAENIKPYVTIDGEELAKNEGEGWQYTVASVSADKTIKVELKTYYALTFDVTDGVILNPSDINVEVEKDGSYTFSMTMTEDFANYKPVVTVNGTAVEITEGDNSWSYTLSNIGDNQNIVINKKSDEGIRKDVTGVHVYPVNGALAIETSKPLSVTVFNVLGRKVVKQTVNSAMEISLPQGLYIVQTNEGTYKVIIR